MLNLLWCRLWTISASSLAENCLRGYLCANTVARSLVNSIGHAAFTFCFMKVVFNDESLRLYLRQFLRQCFAVALWINSNAIFRLRRLPIWPASASVTPVSHWHPTPRREYEDATLPVLLLLFHATWSPISFQSIALDARICCTAWRSTSLTSPKRFRKPLKIRSERLLSIFTDLLWLIIIKQGVTLIKFCTWVRYC